MNGPATAQARSAGVAARAGTAGTTAGGSDGSAALARDAHRDAWRALTRTHAAIVQRLQETLAGADFPPLPWYEVLAAVAEAPEGRLRMGDLAEALVITRGGLTKLFDRLVEAGLVERTFCETDRRVSYATLLPAGRELLAEMRPLVVAELQSAFAAKLSAAEADALRGTLDRIRASSCGTG